MPFLDTRDIEPCERRPGWVGRTFHSPSMTFETEVAGPGMVAIVPAGVSHSVRGITDGKAIVVDWPLRT